MSGKILLEVFAEEDNSDHRDHRAAIVVARLSLKLTAILLGKLATLELRQGERLQAEQVRKIEEQILSAQAGLTALYGDGGSHAKSETASDGSGG